MAHRASYAFCLRSSPRMSETAERATMPELAGNGAGALAIARSAAAVNTRAPTPACSKSRRDRFDVIFNLANGSLHQRDHFRVFDLSALLYCAAASLSEYTQNVPCRPTRKPLFRSITRTPVDLPQWRHFNGR